MARLTLTVLTAALLAGCVTRPPTPPCTNGPPPGFAISEADMALMRADPATIHGSHQLPGLTTEETLRYRYYQVKFFANAELRNPLPNDMILPPAQMADQQALMACYSIDEFFD